MPDAVDDPDELPIPMGVRVDTGKPCPPLTAAEVARLVPAATAEALARNAGVKALGSDSSVTNANELTQTGWAVLFASDADPAIKAQLQPLLDLRQQQVEKRVIPGRPPLFRVFEGADQYKGGVTLREDGTPQTAQDWAQQHGVSLSAPVKPGMVPYYLLIVGSPERIPFEFQADFKLQWLVGRLYFDDIADYGRYAQHVVAQEAAGLAPQAAQTAVWITNNQGDVATTLLSRAICGDFEMTDGKTYSKLGGDWGFEADFSVRGDATKDRLKAILSGSHGTPSILFTGSHGAEFTPPVTDFDAQRETQGALITQEWNPKGDAGPECLFKAEDIPETNILPGMMVFLFACFSAGCPAVDSYYRNTDGSAITIAKVPLISKLAQALLSHGALAVIGHVDRAFKYGFVDTTGTSQAQAFRTPLERLMQGNRAGLAADSFSATWGTLAAGMTNTANPPATAAAALRAHIACDDAKNYFVMGDPAVRLRVAPAS